MIEFRGLPKTKQEWNDFSDDLLMLFIIICCPWVLFFLMWER